VLVNKLSIFRAVAVHSGQRFHVVCAPDDGKEGVSGWFNFPVSTLHIKAIHAVVLVQQDRGYMVGVCMLASNSISVLLVDALGVESVKHELTGLAINSILLI